MIKKKKENKFLEFLLTYGWAFLIILIMIGALAYSGIIKIPIDYYCSKSSDKCVCENWKYYLDKEKRCSDFRYKSQEELDIDDCNNNPREDEKCKCEEEYKLECLNEGLYKFEKNNISFILKLKPNITQRNDFCYPKPKVIEESGAILKEVIYEDIWIAEQKCIKSRPKTECEKGNDGWVEETECVEWLKPNLIKIQESGCNDEICWSKVEIYKKNCIQNQTICREKTK